MRKSIFFTILILALAVTTMSVKAAVLTFQNGLSQLKTKPMIMMVYAPWTNNQYYLPQFKKLQAEFGEKYNYVELDIASKDAKSFNERYAIQPKMPYIVIMREGGKVLRYIHRDCFNDYSCTTSRVRLFLEQR